MIKINLYEAERKHDAKIAEITPYKPEYKSRVLPVIESNVEYVKDALAFMRHKDLIVSQDTVIEKMAYFLGKSFNDLKKEALIHEEGHEFNPDASEEANRRAVSYHMWQSGKQPSELHTKFYFN